MAITTINIDNLPKNSVNLFHLEIDMVANATLLRRMETAEINSAMIKDFKKPLEPLLKEINQADAALKAKQANEREELSNELKNAREVYRQVESQLRSQNSDIKEVLESSLGANLVEIYQKAQTEALNAEYDIEIALREGLHL